MIELLDCTIRDGGYINNWRFTEEFISEYSKITSDISYVEIGFINKTNNYKESIVGPYRCLNEDIIQKFNGKNFKKVVLADFNDINIELLQKKIDIDIVRIAFHRNYMEQGIETCIKVKNMGYKVSVNAMAINNYDEETMNTLCSIINHHDLDIFYIVDSFGSFNEQDILYYYNFFSSKLNNAQIGFHLHNNMNNAFSNYICLKTLNTNKPIIIDTTLFGMGRGAGNLQLELVLINKNINNTIIFDVLKFIQKYIKPIYKHENTWGCDLDFLLSGFLKMHPNHISLMRDLNITMENRFYIIEQMIKDKYDYKFFNKSLFTEFIKKYNNYLL
jgi:4-hydroxy 2-oxovalerate aldolase